MNLPDGFDVLIDRLNQPGRLGAFPYPSDADAVARNLSLALQDDEERN